MVCSRNIKIEKDVGEEAEEDAECNNAGLHYTIVRHCRPGLSACCPPVHAYFLRARRWTPSVVVRAFQQMQLKSTTYSDVELQKPRRTALRVAHLSLVSSLVDKHYLFMLISQSGEGQALARAELTS